MFKKNEAYKQLSAFGINTNLNKQQQKLWDRSREHAFFTELFCKIDESIFSVLYSDKKSRPNTPVNQLVGALILKHLNNWTYQELFSNLNFNLLTRHALGINSLNEGVFCEASIFNFQNKLIKHLSTTGEDLMEQVFYKLTDEQIENWGVNTSIQRGDSFLVGSNIVDYSRLQLLIEVLIRLYRILDKEDIEPLQERLSIYTQFTSSNYVYHINKKDLSDECTKLGMLYADLYFSIGNRYIEKIEYINFKRVFEEHFKIDKKKKIGVKDPKELTSSILMSPDDPEATFRDKNGESHKGFVTHISETVNPENKVNLITDVHTQRNNIGDAEILESRLPIMVERTPDIKEYFIDGLYGSPKVDAIVEKEDIKLYQKTTRGRKSKAGIKIEQDEYSDVWVSCKGGQSVLAIATEKGMKGIFDTEQCTTCPFQLECNLKQTGIKSNKRRVIYFNEEKIQIHKRLANIEKLEDRKRFSRANVEATVKEMKRGMKNKKVRVRGWNRVSMHMIMTAIGINFIRVHKKLVVKLLFLVTYFHRIVQHQLMHNLFIHAEEMNMQTGNLKIAGFYSALLDKKQNQKNQDWLMQPCNAAPTSHNPVRAALLFTSYLHPIIHVLES